jgi:uncharacterized OsmC-like protein
MTDITLESIDRPLTYKVANAEAAGFAPPANRHGQTVRTWVRSLAGIQKEALVTSAATGLSWRFASDEGPHLKGRDHAPNPLSFLSVGMVASFMNEIMALAAQRRVTLSDIELNLENLYYRDGSFRSGNMVSVALPPELTLTCEADCDDRTMSQLLYEAVSASPLNGLMLGTHPSRFTLTHNGNVLTPTHVAALASAPDPDPGDHFGALEVDNEPRVRQPLLEKLAEVDEVMAPFKNAPPPLPQLGEGKYVLQLKSRCRILPNGVKEIIREQVASPSPTWRFLSDEAPGCGGEGRAPDAMSYVAVGIAFCFMTQFGRYSDMAKIPLSAYRVIQDMHFSPGGASAKTGKAGFTDPVETHVYFDSEAAAAAAQDLLRVGERTCFLHALCRDPIKPRAAFRRRRLAAAE